MSSSNRFEMLASGARAVSGQSGQFKIPAMSSILVGVDITAKSGTFGAGEGLDIWLQASDDGGTTWYDVPYDQALTTNTAGTDQTATTDKRNINGTSPATVVGKHVAMYKDIPADTIRLSWEIDGTTPSFTFSVGATGK